MTGPSVTQTVAAKLPDVTPTLANATPERVHEKARGVVVAVVFGVIGILALTGGGILVWSFAKEAIAQHQAISLTLLASLSLPLVPGIAFLMLFALFYDADAGTVFKQFAMVLGSLRRSAKGEPQDGEGGAR